MTAYPADLLFRTVFQETLRVVYKIEEQYVDLITDRVLVNLLPIMRSAWNKFCARQGVTPVWDQVQEDTFSPHDPVFNKFRALGIHPPFDRCTQIIATALEDIARDTRTEPATAAFCRQRISALVAMGNSQNPPPPGAAAPGAPSPASTPGWKGKARASPAPGGNASSQPAYLNPHAHGALPVKSEPRSPAPFPSVRGSTPASHPTVPPAMPPTYEYSASAAFGEGAHYTEFYPLAGSLDYGRDVLPMPAQRPYKIPRTTMEDMFSPAERKDMREPEREFLKSVGL